MKVKSNRREEGRRLTTFLRTTGQRYRLKRMIPRFMLKLINMVGTATEIEFLSSTLDLLIGLSNETVSIPIYGTTV